MDYDPSNICHDIDLFLAEEKSLGRSILLFNEHEKISKPHIIISGFPNDEGTRRNNYRPGGSNASLIFRQTLLNYDIVQKNPVLIFDVGDIHRNLSLEQAYRQLTVKHNLLLERQKETKARGLVFSIGGSQDQSYANVNCLRSLYPQQKIGFVNIDSQLNAKKINSRDQIDEQSHIYQILQQNGSFVKAVQFCCKQSSIRHEEVTYLNKKGVQIIWVQNKKGREDRRNIRSDKGIKTSVGAVFKEVVKRLQESVDLLIVSFDVSSISCKWLPGTSCVNVGNGLNPEEVSQICKVIGSLEKLKIFQVSGFNPAFQSIASASLLVQMFYHTCESFGSSNQSMPKK